MSRAVTDSRIIEQRLTNQQSNNAWNYVALINKDLLKNPITVDRKIIVSFDFVLPSPVITQIEEIYGVEGWDVSTSSTAIKSGTYPGITEFTFSEASA